MIPITIRNHSFLFVVLIFVLNIYSYGQKDVVKKAIASSFKVKCIKANQLSKTGSGFILSQNANTIYGNLREFIGITNEHVLDNIDSAVIELSNGKIIPIEKIIATLHKLDATVFLIKTEEDLGELVDKLTLSKILEHDTEIGDKIFTISSPKGLINSFSAGNISAFREINGTKLVQISAPISPGSSGGLVADENGLPIGVLVSQCSEGQNLNFCLSLKQVLLTLKAQGVYIDEFKYPLNDLTRVQSLEALIANSDKSLIQLSKYLEDQDQDMFYKTVDTTDNQQLIYGFLFLKAKWYLDKKDINRCFEVLLFMYTKYRDRITPLLFSSLLASLNGDFFFDHLNFEIRQLLLNEGEDDIYIKGLLLYIKGLSKYNLQEYEYAITYLVDLTEVLKINISEVNENQQIQALDLLDSGIRDNLLRMLGYSEYFSKNFKRAQEYYLMGMMWELEQINYAKRNKKEFGIEWLKLFATNYIFCCALNEDSKSLCYNYQNYLKEFNIDWGERAKKIIDYNCH